MLANGAINAFKPAEKPYKKADGGGLYLLVQPNGSKIWRFAYRFEGKQKRLSGGHYPRTTLLAARTWQKRMKHQLALGLDPSVERQKEHETGTVATGSSCKSLSKNFVFPSSLGLLCARSRTFRRNPMVPESGHSIATGRNSVRASRALQQLGRRS